MKRFLALVVVVMLALSCVFAGDVKFVLGELAQHPEVLFGFCPTLVTVGASYDGLELVEGNLTQLQVIAGGGYAQFVLYQDPSTGEPLLYDQGVYDSIQLRWSLKALQGFGTSWVEGKDLVTVYAGYEGRLEKNIDSMAVGKNRKLGYAGSSLDVGKTPVKALDVWFNDHGAARDSNVIYPDLAGGDTSFMNSFYFGARLNGMDDEMVSNEGVLAELKFQFAPGFANSKASYYSVAFNAVAGTTLFELSSPSTGRNVFSIVVLDRVNLSWTDGSKVPVYAQQPVSLGRKVRGFNSGSYNANFAVVNNFDIRFAGPEPLVDGIFPRLNVFFDMGYYAGSYLNTGKSALDMAMAYGLERFLCSTGVQVEMSFFDTFDLGLQVAYLVNGRNMRDPWSPVIIGATFFLDF